MGIRYSPPLIGNTGVTWEDLQQNETWDDLLFSASAINPSGKETAAIYDPDYCAFRFDSGSDRVIGAGGQLTHKWKAGSSLRPHIHYGPEDNGSGDVVWRLDIQLREVGDPAPWDPSTRDFYELVTSVSNQANRHLLSSFGDVPAIGYSRSCVVCWDLSRVGKDPRDTYPGDVLLWNFDFHIRLGLFGTVSEYGD